jgi:hypothetical protein
MIFQINANGVVRRRLFNLAAAVSLLLCLATVTTCIYAIYQRHVSWKQMFATFAGNLHIHDSYTSVQVFGIPLSAWVVVTATAILPALWVLNFVRNRRYASMGDIHLCTNCGYDLRASPDRCPECGAQAKPKPQPAHEVST